MILDTVEATLRQYVPKVKSPPKTYDFVFVGEINMYGSLVSRKHSRNDRRIKVFESDNYTCRFCGAVGWCVGCTFNLNNVGNPYEYKIYARKSSGEYLPLTIDHVVPKSKGGTSRMDNLQTLCERCNHRKGDW